MERAYVDLVCPECGTEWEADPSSLPDAGEPYDCRRCGASRTLAEFTKTKRDLEILEEF